MNLLLVFFCMAKFRENRILKSILTVISGCTYIMTASSAYRMILYIEKYTLTFLRVFVLWFLLVIAILLTAVLISIYRKSFSMFKFTVLVIMGGYVFFSLSRPDYFIAKYNTSFGPEDFGIHAYNYSMDAVPVLEKSVQKKGYLGLDEMEYFKNIKKKAEMKEKGVRSFNFSRSQALKKSSGVLGSYEIKYKN